MIETLYFKSYYALLKGNLEECRMYLDFFKEEHKLNPNHKPLNKYQLQGLKDIVIAVSTGNISRYTSNIDPYVTDNVPAVIAPQKQSEIVEKIHKEAFSELRALINAGEGFRLVNIEHPCGDYGAVDMYYRGSEVAYPTEIKKDEGAHDLIGQIMKYDLYFKLQLHLKFYQTVRPITICHSYNNFTLGELKKMGVITLKYKIEDRLKLTLL